MGKGDHRIMEDVCSIYKKGNKMDPKNYKGISEYFSVIMLYTLYKVLYNNTID